MTSLPFESPTVVIAPTFWSKIAAWKLDTVKTTPKAIETVYAYYTLGREGATSRLRIDETSFQVSNNLHIKGRIELYDTIESFQELYIESIYEEECKKLLASFKENPESIPSSESLFPFVLIAHCDLKKHLFRYHFLLPTLFYNDWSITKSFTEYVTLDETVKIVDDTFCIADPSPPKKLSWFIHNLVTALSISKSSDVITIKSCKQDTTTTLVIARKPTSPVNWPAYESTRYSKVVDLAAMLNPTQLAKETSELNLRLMKWRIVPDLDLEVISKCKCLLIGAGTLGCSVARCLLGWNVRTITFVDCGVVSFSNPVRQSLFTFQDAMNKKSKAIAAAEGLQGIDPNVEVKGVDLKVPMPGHQEDRESMETRTRSLEQLIKSHDAIFLLTDSKEARWLPSLLSTLHQRIALTVALGFDSFVIQRHGLTDADNQSCYFCHDVVGPVNSMSNRSLDQQCTVTRPGLSGVASGMAVELLASLLQGQPQDSLGVTEGDGILGAVPHQIRGHLSTFEVFKMTGHKHSNCPSCGTVVQAKAKQDLLSLVQNACNIVGYLEELCGLSQIEELRVQSTSDDFDVILE